jgi:colanic acid biosynthesis protein WcaH
MTRIDSNELNISLKLTPSFIGVFKHFYDDSIYQDALTHYVKNQASSQIRKGLF